MNAQPIPQGLKIQGRQSEEDMPDASMLVKEGTGNSEFTPTVDPADEVLGYTNTGLKQGQHGAIVSGLGSVTLLMADGAVAKGDRLAPSGAGGAKAGYVKASEDVTETFVGYALQACSDGEEFLAVYLGRADEPERILSATPGAEGDAVADAFDIGLDQNLASTDEWTVEAFSDDGTRATDIEFSLQDGNGSMVLGTNTNGVAIFQLHTDGTETLRALDGSGALAADVHLVFRPVDGDGRTLRETIAFA